MAPTVKDDIRSLSFEDLGVYLHSIGEKSFRAEQIFQWIYQKNAWEFEQMSNLSQSLRDRLSIDFLFGRNSLAEIQRGEDGTTKFLLDLADHEKIETVLIPTKTRTTVCVSTQAGCKFGCRFCASGIGGWTRNLTSAEILTQILYVKEEALQRARPLSNIVFMGTGEPKPTQKYYA